MRTGLLSFGHPSITLKWAPDEELVSKLMSNEVKHFVSIVGTRSANMVVVNHCDDIKITDGEITIEVTYEVESRGVNYSQRWNRAHIVYTLDDGRFAKGRFLVELCKELYEMPDSFELCPAEVEGIEGFATSARHIR